MRKYRNVSGVLLHIDCITYTKHFSPGEVATLPVSRDVRHLSRIGQITIVKERKKLNPNKRKKRGRPKKTKKKLVSLEEPILDKEKLKEPLQDMETK